MGSWAGWGLISALEGPSGQTPPLPLCSEIKTTLVAGPQSKRANAGPSMCVVPPEVCVKGKCGLAYLIRTRHAHAGTHN